MKTFSLGPIVLLAVFLSVQLGVATCESEMPTPCCSYFSHYVIPWHWLYSYQITDSSCPNEGVIFTTKSGRRYCVQPGDKWVQRYIAMLNAKKHW
ncbi:C-C motif chemokine 26 [Rattus rattus]|uniref:C-C motif chemokine 26 n=1 Tax=Rattus rattus TaxID=10117 RepID=UPI0013F343A2|nr:C-C motif chemokine 26 [Rattus rattus]